MTALRSSSSRVRRLPERESDRNRDIERCDCDCGCGWGGCGGGGGGCRETDAAVFTEERELERARWGRIDGEDGASKSCSCSCSCSNSWTGSGAFLAREEPGRRVSVRVFPAFAIFPRVLRDEASRSDDDARRVGGSGVGTGGYGGYMFSGDENDNERGSSSASSRSTPLRFSPSEILSSSSCLLEGMGTCRVVR